MKKLFQEVNKKTVVFTVLLFMAFSLLVYFFPYSGDDWAWGSQLGLDRLKTHFENYNGRYMGNLMVLALTRSELLNIIVTGVSLVCVCLFPKLFAGSKSVLPYTFGVILFLLIPKEILVQSVVWTAGYSNYVPPVLLALLYFIFIKNIFDEDKPKYHWITPFVAAAIGFVTALFMENVTLYNIAVSGLIVLFVLIKFRKVYLTHAAHLIGSVLGAVVMFTNSAYGLIASSGDGYRSTAFGTGDEEMVMEHMEVVIEQFFTNNMTVLVILSILCVAAYVLYTRTDAYKRLKTIGLAAVALNAFSCFMLYAKSQYGDWVFESTKSNSGEVTTNIFTAVSVLYLCSAILSVLICVDSKKEKFKTLLLLISVPVLIVPLLLVDPIGPRCFFPPYLMLIAACVLLFVHIQNKMDIKKETRKGLSVSLMAGCLALFTLFFSIYSTIHTYDQKRNEYIKKQIDAGSKTVNVCVLPYNSYVWVGDPRIDPWIERYKLFYDIDQDVQFQYMECKQFDQWVAEFDAKAG